MKKIILLSILNSLSCASIAQTKIDITQTNPLKNILSYNMQYISQAQKLLDSHQGFTQNLLGGSPTISYLQLDDIRGAQVSIISNVSMDIIQANFIHFDNQELRYVINTEKTSQLIVNSCQHVKFFLSKEPIKINSILGSNLDMILNISLKDGYVIHIKYTC